MLYLDTKQNVLRTFQPKLQEVTLIVTDIIKPTIFFSSINHVADSKRKIAEGK